MLAEESCKLSKTATIQTSVEKPTTFGVGRESFNKVVSINNFNYVPFDSVEPGPGAYNPIVKSTKKRYSMRPKTTVDSKFFTFLYL